MGSFSWSSKNKSYKNGHYGSNHYQRRGIFGNLLNIFGSGSFSGHHQNYPGNYPNHPYCQGSNQVVVCPNCNGQIPAGSKFCAHCGEKMAELLFCSSCGEKLLPNAKFCAKCGTQANG